MKKTYLRAGVAAMACALGLSACGGSSGQLVLGGTITGITKETAVLQNNGSHDTTVTGSGEFYFNDLIAIDEQYNVTVKSFPSNVEKCTVYNGTGRSAFNVTTVQIICELKQHAITATVSGLGTATGLVVVNGTTKFPIAADGTNVNLGTIGEDSPYGFAVLTQPAGRVCSIANASGTMGTTPVTNVAITCVSTGT
jgi:opacity protein-like surface antigen